MKKLGFLGCGAMGGAILGGALKNGFIGPENVYIYDISEKICDKYREMGCNIVSSVEELGLKADLVFLAVKPQYSVDALKGFGKSLSGKAVISIMAGKTNEFLQKMIEGDVRILRVMPNTPALVSAGCFALCDENTLNDEERKFADDLFKSMGMVVWMNEHLLGVASGFSGAIPCFTAMFIEGLSDGAVKMGMPRQMAYMMAEQAVLGSAKLLQETGMHPGQLKDMVCSPGGATIEGVEAMEHLNFREASMKAVVATTEKALKL